MTPFSIMHISDLHRSPRDPISNDELISALVHDRDRYLPTKTHDAAHTTAALFRGGKPIRGKNRNNAMNDAVPVTITYEDEKSAHLWLPCDYWVRG